MSAFQAGPLAAALVGAAVCVGVALGGIALLARSPVVAAAERPGAAQASLSS